jgi:hypothetical protein
MNGVLYAVRADALTEMGLEVRQRVAWESDEKTLAGATENGS